MFKNLLFNVIDTVADVVVTGIAVGGVALMTSEVIHAVSPRRRVSKARPRRRPDPCLNTNPLADILGGSDQNYWLN